jgi:hypothetical protein
MIVPQNLSKLVKAECERRQINPNVISAIISTESNWQANTARYEKNFTYTFKADLFANMFNITLQTENTLQKFSWGLMQIMGGTARDLGFSGWVPDLCKPEIGVMWGCEYFEKRCMDYLDLNDQLAAYNAGSVKRKSNGSYINQEYVDKVLSLFHAFNNKRI